MTLTIDESAKNRAMYFGVNIPDALIAKHDRIREPNKPEHELALYKSDEKDIDRLDDVELEDELKRGTPRSKNIAEKLDAARTRRKVDRGERLDPAEIDRLESSPSADSKSLLELNKKNAEPVRFTLSPMKALIRSL